MEAGFNYNVTNFTQYILDRRLAKGLYKDFILITILWKKSFVIKSYKKKK